MAKFIVLIAALLPLALGQDECPLPNMCDDMAMTCWPLATDPPPKCPVDPICVPFSSAVPNKEGGDCPIHCPVFCAEGEKMCMPDFDFMGCPLQRTCVPENDKCPDPMYDSNGCQIPAYCDKYSQDFPELFCPGPKANDGCPQVGFCIPASKGISAKGGRKCPNFCHPDDCPNGETCFGGFASDGCELPTTCKMPGQECPAPSFGPDGCPVGPPCKADEQTCTESRGHDGCPPKTFCEPVNSGIIGKDGQPCLQHCPLMCDNEPYTKPCPADYDSNGCPMPSFCELPQNQCPAPTHGPDGCPIPKGCPENMLQCYPPQVNFDAPPKCPPEGFCIDAHSPSPKGIPCKAHCPLPCGQDEVPCPPQYDSNGCLLPEICAPAAASCPVSQFDYNGLPIAP